MSQDDLIKKVAEVLRVMDEEVLPDERHWVKHHDLRIRPGGMRCCCLQGARYEALADVMIGIGRTERQAVRDGVRQAIHGCLPRGFDRDTAYNDAPSTTFEDVKTVLTCAREKVSS